MAVQTGKELEGALSEINVTPLVDVMLVLLIIFMIVAPKLTSGVKVNLPKVEAAPVKISSNEVIISVTSDGGLQVGKKMVSLNELSGVLREQMQTNAKNNVYLKADENVRYGMVAEVMARVKAAGISGLGIITEPPRKPQEQENQ